MAAPVFIEVDHSGLFKNKQMVGGDVFMSRIIKNEERVVSVLSDGLGSGIKASVLSILTATMALNYVTNRFDVIKTAKVIMGTLPVCSRRKLSYSTFTIVDMDSTGQTAVIEYGNPRFIFLRGGEIQYPDSEALAIECPNNPSTDDPIYYSRFKVKKGDRLILMSDGVTQAGMGKIGYPMGWGEERTRDYIADVVNRNPNISARVLSKHVVEKARHIDDDRAGDDITCGVINVRTPRRTLVMSGPPLNRERDRNMAELFESFEGKRIICGGTTANIIARETQRLIAVNVSQSWELPPTSTMEGVDLITEGSLTLGKVVEYLENNTDVSRLTPNAATEMVQLFRDSDIIQFVIGTRINEAHQDPNIPVELEIRRNLVKRIIHSLEETHLKETKLTFI